MQLADMIRERDKLKSELSMMKDSRVEEIARLRKELEASEARVAELGRVSHDVKGEMNDLSYPN